MLAHTELLKDTSGFTGSIHFLRRASRIVWNAFASQQNPVLRGAYNFQRDLDQKLIAEEPDSRSSCDAISEAMNKLPIEHREILIMICVEGLRYADAADKLGITIDTVYGRLSSARQELQQELQDLLAQGS